MAKWGGEALTAGEPAQVGEGSVARESSTVAACQAEIKVRQEFTSRLGLAPETPEGELWQKSVELFRDLAQSLSLPQEATASQLKGGLAALMAGGEQVQALQEELTALKDRLSEETARQAVEEAMVAGKVSPAQRDWALSYCRQDPESFKIYVDKAPRVVPVGERLNLGEEQHREDKGLTPEELAVCRTMNLSPEAYSEAKARMAQAK